MKKTKRVKRIHKEKGTITQLDNGSCMNDKRTKPLIKTSDRSHFVAAKLEVMQCHPEELLAYIVNRNYGALNCTEEELDIKFRAAAAKELMRYTHPTLKAVEVSGPNGTAVNLNSKERKERIKQLLKEAYGG